MTTQKKNNKNSQNSKNSKNRSGIKPNIKKTNKKKEQKTKQNTETKEENNTNDTENKDNDILKNAIVTNQIKTSTKTILAKKSTQIVTKKKISKKKVITKILTHHGYALVKEHFGFRAIHKCKKDLTVKPYVHGDFGANPNSFPIYLENERKLYLPRHYGVEHFGDPDQVKINTAFDIDLTFNGTLYNKPGQDQQKAAEIFLNTCKPGSYSSQTFGGILALYPAFGKTALALYLITKLKKKTIVVVHTEFLMTQWRERIQQFVPDARIGIIQRNKVQVKNKDIVIAMLQSISMKNYPPEIFKSFGFLVADECHHLSSEMFSRCLPKLGCKYTLGLSGTPKRNDGLSKVFHWYLGPILYAVAKREENIAATVECIEFHSKKVPYSKVEVSNYGKVIMGRMITNICEYMKRTKLIVEIIKLCIKDGRTIIFLSERRNHLTDIFNMVTENNICTVGYYVGGMKDSERKKSEKQQLILGTYAMASEGLDIPSLNTIIFGSPKSNITQSFGRILRKINPEIPPKGYDIIDKSMTVFDRQFIKRRRFYKRHGYEYKFTKVFDHEDYDEEDLIRQYNTKKPEEKKIKTHDYRDLLKGQCLLNDE